MATVNKIFKPRRGKKSTMAGTKANTVLAAGELFLETPDTGVGKGASKIKIGDGSTKYSSLPYALGDTTNDVITYSSNSSTTVATALNNVASGKKLGLMIAGLKQAVSLLNTSVTSLNDDISELQSSFQDGCSTIAAKITSLGIDTAANASIDTICTNIEQLVTNTNISNMTRITNKSVDMSGWATLSAALDKDYDYILAACVAWNSSSNGNIKSFTCGSRTVILKSSLSICNILLHVYIISNAKSGDTVSMYCFGEAAMFTLLS